MPWRSATEESGRTISAPRPTERRNPSSSLMTVLPGAVPGGSADAPHRSSAAPVGASRPLGTKMISLPGKHWRTMGRFQRGNPQAWSTAGRSRWRSALAAVSVTSTDMLNQVVHHGKMTLPGRSLESDHSLELRLAPLTVRLGIVKHRRLPAGTVERIQIIRYFARRFPKYRQVAGDHPHTGC